MKILLAVSLTAWASFSVLSTARADWDAGKDLASNEKPDGAAKERVNPNPTVPEWSYGYRTTIDSIDLRLATAAEHLNNHLGLGLDGYGAPGSILCNPKTNEVFIDNGFGPLLPLAAGAIVLHPTASNEPVIVRWTAPATGVYVVSAYWQDIDPYGGNGVTGHIVVNGASNTEKPISTEKTSVTRTLPLKAGDVVDFGVGSAGDNTFDSTAFNATIVKLSAISLTGVTNGSVVVPKSKIQVTAAVNPIAAPVKNVQFFVDGKPRVPLTNAPYELEMTVEAPGPRAIYAVSTDTLGNKATSETIQFTVADSAAGALALQTFVEPSNGEIAPGGSVFYTLIATNTSPTAKLTAVKLAAPSPNGANIETANFVNEHNNPIKITAPSGKNPAISATGSSADCYFGDFNPGEVKRLRLKLRVAFDVHEGDDDINNAQFTVTGAQSAKKFSGRFAVKPVEIRGLVPNKAPQLALAKGIVDQAAVKTDDTDFAATADGTVAITSSGDTVSFFLVATNNGAAPASKVTVTDRIPDGFSYVDKTAKVNGKTPGSFKAQGRTMTFTFGDFAPGESVAIDYQLLVKPKSSGGPSEGAIVKTAAAEMHAQNLENAVDSTPEELSIQILSQATLILEQTKAFPSQIKVNGLQTYQIPYRNIGNREARNVRIRAVVPERTTFGKAYLSGTPSQTFPRESDDSVVFEVGNVPAGRAGSAILEVKGNKELLKNPEKGVVFLPPSLPATAPARASVNAEQNALPGLFLFPEFNPVNDAKAPKIGVCKHGPMSVQEGGLFAYTYTAINHSNITLFAQINIPRPEGALFQYSDNGKEGSRQSPITPDTSGIGISWGRIPAHEVRTVRVFMKATAPVGSILLDTAYAINDDGAPSVSTKASPTLVIRGDAKDPDNQISIVQAQLSYANNDACAALTNEMFLGRTRNITSSSRQYLVDGVDAIQLTSGGYVVPTGAGRLVAAGAGNLIGNDGSTLENLGGANLIGNDGGTIVLEGPANQIFFNLVGNDGASLIGNDGGTLLDQLVRGKAGNLVAAGAGNLVAAGAGNLIGNDGAGLIGNDSGGFFPIKSLISSVQAAGGNLFAVGLGAFEPTQEAIVSNGEATLVAAGGGNLVAAGGGNISPVGATRLISVDHSSAVMIGVDGSMMSAGGLRVDEIPSR